MPFVSDVIRHASSKKQVNLISREHKSLQDATIALQFVRKIILKSNSQFVLGYFCDLQISGERYKRARLQRRTVAEKNRLPSPCSLYSFLSRNMLSQPRYRQPW